MIRIFNSATFRFDNSERFIPLEEVNVVSVKMDYNGAPYLLFEHKDFPLGGLYATFDGELWQCDMD
jgi:hypothetical protein